MALRFLIAMALLCGGSVPVMAFVDPLAIPAYRGGSASRTPLPPVQYRLRGGTQAFAAGEGGGDSIPERLAAVQAKIKHAGQPNGARGMPRKHSHACVNVFSARAIALNLCWSEKRNISR
jgi:hypothetical protein